MNDSYVNLMAMKERIAKLLDWSMDDVNSLDLRSLRELVRPLSAKLTHEMDLAIRSGSYIIGERLEP